LVRAVEERKESGFDVVIWGETRAFLVPDGGKAGEMLVGISAASRPFGVTS